MLSTQKHKKTELTKTFKSNLPYRPGRGAPFDLTIPKPRRTWKKNSEMGLRLSERFRENINKKSCRLDKLTPAPFSLIAKN